MLLLQFRENNSYKTTKCNIKFGQFSDTFKHDTYTSRRNPFRWLKTVSTFWVKGLIHTNDSLGYVYSPGGVSLLLFLLNERDAFWIYPYPVGGS